jgi:hypothetical protein
MLILGGNSHNESSAIRKNDCYSNQVFAYDISNVKKIIPVRCIYYFNFFIIVCKKWLPISIKEFDLASRYGHDTFSDGKDVYVVGGFNGQILNDILKFTPGISRHLP